MEHLSYQTGYDDAKSELQTKLNTLTAELADLRQFVENFAVIDTLKDGYNEILEEWTERAAILVVRMDAKDKE